MNRETIKNVLDKANISVVDEINILEYIEELQKRFDFLMEAHIMSEQELEEKEDRIDKAIEYIKQYGNLYCLKHKQFKDYQQYKELLDILRGKEDDI